MISYLNFCRAGNILHDYYYWFFHDYGWLYTFFCEIKISMLQNISNYKFGKTSFVFKKKKLSIFGDFVSRVGDVDLLFASN